MDALYLKIVNTILPSEFISQIVTKTNVNKKDVEQISIEVIARVLGNGSNISKENIEHNIKKVVASEELRGLLTRLKDKYGIESTNASRVLSELLPMMFKKVNSLPEDFFVKKEEEHPVAVAVKEEPPVVEEETTVDDVYKNIENKAKLAEQSKNEANNKALKKKNKKEKRKNEAVGNIDDRELSLIEKICMGVVLASLIALIAVVVILLLKTKA